MHHELQILADPDPDAVARAGAAFVAERARAAVAADGSFHFAAGRVEAAASLVMADRAAT